MKKQRGKYKILLFSAGIARLNLKEERKLFPAVEQATRMRLLVGIW